MAEASGTGDLSHHSIPINPLANPKGLKLECELCSKTAYLQCKGCRVTYYCDKEHEAIDYRGIHAKICQLLIPLRTPVPTLGSENERAARDEFLRQRQVQLAELSRTEAQKLLFECQYDLAIPAALQALRFSMLLSGQESIDLVPSYLLLGKASIGLKQYVQAEEYLSLAKWAILKVHDCAAEVQGLLHRNIGLLYLSQGNYDDALQELALDVYYHSNANNPEHISVSGGYYQIGNVFHKQNRIELVSAFYDKVAHIWKMTLKENQVKLDAAQRAEAVHMLTTIYAFRSNYSKGLISTAEIDYVLGLLFTSCGDNEKAKDHATKAFTGTFIPDTIQTTAFESALGREHTLTIDARNLYKSILGESANSKPAARMSISREKRSF